MFFFLHLEHRQLCQRFTFKQWRSDTDTKYCGRTSSSSFEDAQQYQSWGNFVRSRAVNLKFFLRAVFAVQTVPGTKVNKVFPPRWRKLQEESSKQKSFYLCDQNKFCIYVYHYNAEILLTCVGLVNLTLAELCYLSWLWLTLTSRKYGTTAATGQLSKSLIYFLP